MIVIDVSARVNKIEGPLKKVTSVVEKMEKSIDKAAQAMEKLASAAAKVGAFGGNFPAVPRGPGSGGGGGRVPRAPKQPAGPTPMDQYRYINALNSASGGRIQGLRNSALQSTFTHYQRLASQGNPQAMRAVASLAPSMAKLNAPGKGVGHYAKQALMSSRFSVGGSGGPQMMPLIGRTMAMLTRMGPVGMAAATALALVAADALVAAKAIGILGGAATRMTGAQTGPATLGSLDRLAGVLGGNSAELAQRFGSNISNGTGAGAAAAAGINPYSGPYGDFDIGSKLAKYAEVVARSSSYKEAMRAAVKVGMPELAKLFYLSKEQKRDAFSRRNGYSERDIRAGVQGEYAVNRMNMAWMRLFTSMERLFGAMARWTSTMNGIAASMDRISSGEFQRDWDRMQKDPEFAAQKRWQMSQPQWNFDRIERAKSGAVDSEKRNTEALDRNTRALNRVREIQGGGSRAQGVIPRNIPGSRLGDPAYRQALEGGIG